MLWFIFFWFVMSWLCSCMYLLGYCIVVVVVVVVVVWLMLFIFSVAQLILLLLLLSLFCLFLSCHVVHLCLLFLACGWYNICFLLWLFMSSRASCGDNVHFARGLLRVLFSFFFFHSYCLYVRLAIWPLLLCSVLSALCLRTLPCCVTCCCCWRPSSFDYSYNFLCCFGSGCCLCSVVAIAYGSVEFFLIGNVDTVAFLSAVVFCFVIYCCGVVHRCWCVRMFLLFAVAVAVLCCCCFFYCCWSSYMQCFSVLCFVRVAVVWGDCTSYKRN